MTLRINVLACIGCGVVVGAAAVGQDADKAAKGKASRGASFESLDRNGDGKLSKDELPERARRMMDRMDADGNGSVSKDEFQKARDQRERGEKSKKGADEKGDAAKSGRLFDYLDKDSDGRISKVEAPDRMKESFGRADANGDGAISKEEFLAGTRRMEAMAAALKGKKKSGEPTKPSEAAKAGAAKAGALFTADMVLTRTDRNGDGKLSKDEAPEQMKAGFGMIDSDKDGFLSKAELERMLEQRRRMAGAAGVGGAGGGRSPKQLFHEQDHDADGRVTKDEAKGVLAERFRELDVGKDGRLDVQEVENGLKTAGAASKRNKRDAK